MNFVHDEYYLPNRSIPASRIKENCKRNSPSRRGGTTGTPPWGAVMPERSGVMASVSFSRGDELAEEARGSAARDVRGGGLAE